jgi:tetratricopeptide (TPR) repeat protein
MATDAYSPCPCGSGKKFKWCCQPIHVGIDKAFRLEADGQYDAALKTMDEVVQANPTNPEAIGRKAQLLYDLERVDEAETTLQKALDINPRYPFGHLLRGLFRYHEGEVPGALLLFRKAAELYDPDARAMLGRVYDLIGECELRLNRPVAGRAALQISLRCQPNVDLAKSFEERFGNDSRYPLAARREYSFQSPPAGAPGGRRAAWDQALRLAGSPKLNDLVHAFEQLTKDDAEDGAAWYNLGLARAWLGDNRGAVEALDNYVPREPDETKAAAAWDLAEVLLCGQGMEDQADFVEHSFMFQMRDPEQVVRFLGQWEQERRLAGIQVHQEQGILTAMVLDRVTALTPELAATQPPRFAAHLFILGGMLRLSGPNRDALDRARDDLQQRIGGALSEPRAGREPVPFHDVIAEAIVFPTGELPEPELKKTLSDYMGRFFEDTWIHRPLPALDRAPPGDAAGHATLRKKLRGVIQFLEECAAVGQYPYDFNRLRGKLGLLDAPAAPGPVQATMDIGGMNAAELATLTPDTLTEGQADLAYQTALKLDARDLAGVFARSLVSRPPNPKHVDRYPWYGHLVQLALADGDTTKALDYINDGEKADCEQNEGRRRNDYELRRGQIHAKRGETDQAQDVFDRLIARVPSELRYRGSAAEAMLSARSGNRALTFAEQGLAKAREKNDRDLEDYFRELVAAAKKVTLSPEA